MAKPEISEIGQLALAIKKHSDMVLSKLTNTRRVRRRVCHAEGGELMTLQSPRDQVDINKILDRWLKHGTAVAHLNPQVATYGDFSSGHDYASALNAVKAAEADFAALPARVRAACGNSPAEFLQIIFDPEREEEREGLGLGFTRSLPADTGKVSGGDQPADTVVVEGEPKAVPRGGE